MHNAVSRILCILKSGDHSEYPSLFRPLKSGLETYKIVHCLGTVILSELQTSIRFHACLGINETYGPERFSAETNGYLDCANCKEKLCVHKKQLTGLRKKIAKLKQKKIKDLAKAYPQYSQEIAGIVKRYEGAG